jgi:hypothetical protein
VRESTPISLPSWGFRASLPLCLRVSVANSSLSPARRSPEDVVGHGAPERIARRRLLDNEKK